MPAVLDTYTSIAAKSDGLFKDNGSRFIALAYPVETEDEVRDIVASLKKEYHDARHNCYAYRLGLDGSRWRANDDGEPSGSAGRPILGQIDSAGLSDILVVVVRYFGGIKLGIPGLIRAYRTSTMDALSHASTVTKVDGAWYRMRYAYGLMPQAMKAIKDMDLPQRNQNFGADCILEVRVRKSLAEDFFEKMKNLDIFIEQL